LQLLFLLLQLPPMRLLLHAKVMPCGDLPLEVNVQPHVGMLHVPSRLLCFAALAVAAAADVLAPVSV